MAGSRCWLKCTGIHLSASLYSCDGVVLQQSVSSRCWPLHWPFSIWNWLIPHPPTASLSHPQEEACGYLPLPGDLSVSTLRAAPVMPDFGFLLPLPHSSPLASCPCPPISHAFLGLHFFPACTWVPSYFSVRPQPFLTPPPPYPPCLGP